MWRSHIGTNGLISFLPHFSLPCSSPSPSLPLHSPYLSCPLTLETVLAPPPGGGREWVLVGVAGSSHLGSKERIREKLLNLQGSVLREVEAGQKALQEVHSQQAQVQDAEARAKDLQIQLGASEDAYQQSLRDFQRSLQALQAEKRLLEGALQKSQAEKLLFKTDLSLLSRMYKKQKIKYSISSSVLMNPVSKQ